MAVREEHRKIVKTGMWAAAGASVPGAFFAPIDLAGTAAAWTTMIAAMAQSSGHTMDRQLAGKVAAGIVVGGTAYVYAGWALVKGLSNLALVVPLVGIFGKAVIASANSAANLLITYRLGSYLSEMLSHPEFSEEDLLAFGRHIAPFLIRIPSLRELDELRLTLMG